MSEYELNIDNDDQTVEPIDIENSTDFTDKEKELLKKMEDLSNECAENGVSCFLSAKFDTQKNPSASWFFGNEPKDAYMMFAQNFAPLLMHITSNLTGTKVTAVNTETGKTVYEVEPKQ